MIEEIRIIEKLYAGKWDAVSMRELNIGDIFKVTDIVNGVKEYIGKFKATSKPFIDANDRLTIGCEEIEKDE